MNPTGKKQIREAVAIAALSTLVAGIVQWGVEEVRQRYQKPKKKKRKKKVDKGE